MHRLLFTRFLISVGILIGVTACAAPNGPATSSSAPPATLSPDTVITATSTGDQITPTAIPPQRSPMAVSTPEAPTPAAASGDPQAVWQRVRTVIPADIPVYQPTWLPERFRQESATIWYVSADAPYDPHYAVSYVDEQGTCLLFALGAVNSAPPTATADLALRNRAATWALWSATDDWPAQQVQWREAANGASRVYAVQTGDAQMTRDELLQIVARLAPVTATGSLPAP
ncbi:MAG: hypothetical protein RMJ55_13415 [Roseiflexaceae bacterium]|nr:hypothetical protein [Roseiflexus sp.]MCS7289013.1 hypothetical protein [Roseiflexus sp.]MDW8148435.1 hypothetical protein [Roseiflexaceae bacterium]MDW8214552.1 hypothetical protein [Roseiflexaceae bacterium]